MIHREPLTTEIFGKEFYLAHGDGLGDPDKKFKMLRAMFRSRKMCIRDRVMGDGMLSLVVGEDGHLHAVSGITTDIADNGPFILFQMCIRDRSPNCSRWVGTASFWHAIQLRQKLCATYK